MKIITCEDFNRLEMYKWHRAVTRQKSSQPSLIIPSSNYGIRNKNGVLRKSGFVLLGADGYSWFKTKKEAVVKRRIAKLEEINA